MPNSSRMQWPFPAKDTDPWFVKFESMVTAMDSSGFASREDRQLILGGGGNVSWDAGTSTLSWDAALEIYSSIAGYRLDIDAGSILLEDGELLYVDLTRFPTQNVTLGTASTFSIPNTDDAYALAIRRGTDIYWRHGVKIATGETVNIFSPSAGVGSDIYQKDATFSVPEGTATDEATLGRVVYAGSMIGLSVEITRPVVSGTVTVNAKIGGVTAMTVVLNSTDTTSKQLTVVGGTHPIVQNDSISVEVVTSSYTNADTLDAGLTVDVMLLNGLAQSPGDIPDASDTQKGITKLSVAPVLANDPIAVGDNDSRIYESRRVIHTIGGGDGSDFYVTFAPAMPSTDYIIVPGLGTVSSHVSMNMPTANRGLTTFRVITSAALVVGETLYFHVLEI